MKSMIISEKEKNLAAGNSIVADSPKYPYGLRLELNPESVKKLELKNPQVGQKMMMLAVIEVVGVANEGNWGDATETRVSLQITDMDIKPHKEEKAAEEVIYGKE
jgi:hypothetical protein